MRDRWCDGSQGQFWKNVAVLTSRTGKEIPSHACEDQTVDESVDDSIRAKRVQANVRQRSKGESIGTRSNNFADVFDS